MPILEEKTLLFWGTWAVIAVIATAVAAIAYHFLYRRAARPIPLFRLIVVGLFAAMVLQYIPILQYDPQLGSGDEVCFRTILLAAYRVLRVFLVDGDWESTFAVLETVKTVEYPHLKQIYETVCYIGLLVAPALSATFLLSFFNSLFARLRFFFSWFRPVFVFSKLNAQSLAFARSVRKRHPFWANIVFTDVFYEHGDDGYELLCEAKDLRAVCLKRDITHLWFGCGWWKKVTCLIMGEDESENLAQVMTLTEKWKERKRTSIYVYATSVGSGYIMDSMEKGQFLMPASLEKRIKRKMGLDKKGRKKAASKADTIVEDINDQNEVATAVVDLLDGDICKGSSYPMTNGFLVRRIDSVYDVVLETFCKSDVFGLCDEVCGEDKVISLLIVGMGEYGKQIFKTALWFCQMEGYRLEINIIDSGFGKNRIKRDIKNVLQQECPEILSYNGEQEDGEAQYDIKIFRDIDCFSSSLDDVFKNNKTRLRRTLMTFVALGDDDKNIEAAILLRKLFDRLHGRTDADCKVITNMRKAQLKDAERRDTPRIYAVVYDDRKAKNLNINKEDEDDSYLVDYKGTPYHIHCIGNLSTHYSYDKLRENQKLEWEAFVQHTRWVVVERTIRMWLGHKDNTDLCQEVLKTEGKALAGKSRQLLRDAPQWAEDGARMVAEGERLAAEGAALVAKAEEAYGKRKRCIKARRKQSEAQKAIANGNELLKKGNWLIQKGTTLLENAANAPAKAEQLQQDSRELLNAAQTIMQTSQPLPPDVIKTVFAKIPWDDAYWWTKTPEQQYDEVVAEISKYMQFEYYRYSSIATTVHKRFVVGRFKDTMQCQHLYTGEADKIIANPLCRCSACRARRNTEHRRWNAYMRANGYRYGKKRADRAQVHPNLVATQALSWKDQFKD